MDVPKLIMLVQNYPELYNMRHSEYFNNVRRDNCWEEIGGIMNEQGKIVLKQKKITSENV